MLAGMNEVPQLPNQVRPVGQPCSRVLVGAGGQPLEGSRHSEELVQHPVLSRLRRAVVRCEPSEVMLHVLRTERAHGEERALKS